MIDLLKALSWADWWAAIQGLALIATAGIAWHQLGSLREDQKNWETLKACERYDTDPVLTRALETLRDVRNAGVLKSDPRRYSLEMTTVLNYLEGILIGVEQGFYNAKIVRDHLEPVIKDHVKEFLGEPLRTALVDKDDDYIRLERMVGIWADKPTHFQGRRR